MEETVGIYDPEGLLAYAAYFRDALVIGVTMDYIPKVDNSSNGKLDLVLQYKISTLTLEGRLQVCCNMLFLFLTDNNDYCSLYIYLMI